MARPNYSPQAHQRARQLLQTLVEYANGAIEVNDAHTVAHLDRLRSQIKVNWQTSQRLVVQTKIRFLKELCAVIAEKPLERDHIKEAIKRFQDHVNILEDNRASAQGSDVWHFTLHLWYSRWDVEQNLKQFDIEWEKARPQKSRDIVGSIATLDSHNHFRSQPNCSAKPVRSWAEAMDVSRFYGRTEELKTLEQWILGGHHRLIALLGMGGIGKTALSVKLARQIQDEFDVVVWRSLRNAPPLQPLLIDLIAVVSNQTTQDLPTTVDGLMVQLIEYLRSQRCLIVLDNFESILQQEERAGTYRSEYAGYEQLLRGIGESSHQSCLVLTSREHPKGLAVKESQYAPMRSLRLTGLDTEAVSAVLQEKDIAIASDTAQILLNKYAGNPLALKIVATTIQELFEGDVRLFLEQGTTIFGDIVDLLDQQFNRLSDLERHVMTWLAIAREPVTITALQHDLIPPVRSTALFNALESLQRRSLIEKSSLLGQQSAVFTQQPVVMEYITDGLIEQICYEVQAAMVNGLDDYALIQAEAKDYVRQTQNRLILQPIAEHLLAQWGRDGTQQRLDQILDQLKQRPIRQPGYAAGNILNLLAQLSIDLRGYDFSNLAVWQVYLQGMTLPQLNFAGADLSRSVFTQTIGGVLSAAFSPDGQRLATGIDHDIIIWQIADGKSLKVLQGHTNWVVSVAFSPDGRMLASGSSDRTVRLWDLETGQCLKTLRDHTSWVQTVVFSPDGQQLASAGNDHVIRLWDVQTYRCVQTLEGHCDRILRVLFSPNGQTLISSGQDQTIRLWSIATGDCLQVIETHINWVLAMALSPDGCTLAIGSNGNTVKLWDVHAGEHLRTLDYSSHVWAVDFSPNGQTLATASEDHAIKLWSTETGKCIDTLQAHSQGVWLVTFSPSGQALISISDDQTIRLWQVGEGQCLRTLQIYSNWISSVTFHSQEPILASGGQDALIRIWQPDTGQCIHTLAGHTDAVASVSFSPDSAVLASSSDDRTIKIWNWKTGDCIKTLWGHQAWIHALAFSPNGQILASGSHDQTLKLWDIRSGECLQTLMGHAHPIKAIAFDPRGMLLASASDDQTVKLWGVEVGSCIQTLTGHDDWVLSVAFHPFEPLLASSSGDQTIRLWNSETGENVRSLIGHSDRVRMVTFSPNGELLASCGDDQTVRLWNVLTGECQTVIDDHSQAIWSIAFNPDGGSLACSGKDEVIRLWDIRSGECLETLTLERPYESMNITGVFGLTTAQKATLKALGAVDLEQS